MSSTLESERKAFQMCLNIFHIRHDDRWTLAPGGQNQYRNIYHPEYMPANSLYEVRVAYRTDGMLNCDILYSRRDNPSAITCTFYATTWNWLGGYPTLDRVSNTQGITYPYGAVTATYLCWMEALTTLEPKPLIEVIGNPSWCV